MNILLTGSGGFIGSHLTETLLAAGHRVRALVHYRGDGGHGHLDGIGDRISDEALQRLEIVSGDVTDTGQMLRLVEGCDAVCHLAALIGIPYSYEAPGSYVATNVVGTMNLLDAARHHRVSRVVVTSTSEVYGTARYSPIDEAHPLQGQSPYSASKIGADKLAEAYHCSFGVPVVTIRPFNTYGPRQSDRAIIPTVLSQAFSGASEIRLGSLDPRRDLTFVADTARAFQLALETPGIEGETIHFGSGKAIRIGDLAEWCLRIAGSDARIVSSAERTRPEKSEVGLLLADPSKAGNLLGWKPEIGLEEGLSITARHLEEHLSDYQPSRYSR